MFGLIGYFNGQLSIQLLSTQRIILPGTFSYTGVIGHVNGTQSIFMNIQILFQMIVNKGNVSGSLAGILGANQQSIYNISIESQIQANSIVGLISAGGKNCKITQTQIFQSQAIGSMQNENQYSAGLIASTDGYMQIIQCIIKKIKIQSHSNYTWAISGGLFGDIFSTLTQIQQTQLISSQIFSSGSVSSSINSGGLVGYQFDGQMDAIDVLVKFTNITAISYNQPGMSTFCGTFAAFLIRQKIHLRNSKISSIHINVSGSSNQYVGIILGVNWTIGYTAYGVSTDGVNKINGGVIVNCASVVAQSQSGC
ncbi:Hypothetical_protein [Hexamita inflata]|nr:Hypothetical protein HINF_LOCUS36642 [Hexamita inflata]CAI9962952.1 Hypothetical protein HINF_LOCUS50597 [Hexamita inflata]